MRNNIRTAFPIAKRSAISAQHSQPSDAILNSDTRKIVGTLAIHQGARIQMCDLVTEVVSTYCQVCPNIDLEMALFCL